MFNSTAPTNTSNIATVAIQTGPSALIIVLMSVSIWIVLANALVLTCLVVSRHALTNFVNLQIMTFSVTDTLVGLSAIPVTMTFKIVMSFPYFWPCASVLYGYSVAQAATLYHAFVICIHRLMTIKRCTGRLETNPRRMYRTLLIQISIPWIEALIIVAIPFLVFGKHDAILPGCSLNTVFEDNYKAAMTLLNINLLTPHIGMNVSYIYMLIFLLRKWKRLDILRDHSTTAATVATSSRTIGNTSSGSSIMKTEITSQNRNSEIPDCGIHIISQSETGTLSEAKGRVVMRNVFINSKQSNNDVANKTHKGKTRQQLTRKSKGNLGMRGQKDVLITIGLLLLVLNVFMTPLTFLVVIESLNVDLLSRKVKFIVMVFALMNSALNPFIYIFRIKPFRQAIRGIWIKILSRCCSRI